jgi:hypothetical protein
MPALRRLCAVAAYLRLPFIWIGPPMKAQAVTRPAYMPAANDAFIHDGPEAA